MTPICVLHFLGAVFLAHAVVDVDVKRANQTGRKALVVIDVQHCFTNGITADGSPAKTDRTDDELNLQSPRGNTDWKNSVVNYVQSWMDKELPIVLLQDYHPKQHVSFITKQGGEAAWRPLLNGSRTMNKRDFLHSNTGSAGADDEGFPEEGLDYIAPVFPSHCVQGTTEANLVDGLCEVVQGRYEGSNACITDAPNVKVVQKGTNSEIDSFGGVYDNRMGYITELGRWASMTDGVYSPALAKRASWGVLEWLNSHSVDYAETIGIADDYCVKTTALDLANKEKAAAAGATAIPVVEVNPQYTYGIAAHLWEKPGDGPFDGHGIAEVYEGLKADLQAGGVRWKKEPRLARVGRAMGKLMGKLGRGK